MNKWLLALSSVSTLGPEYDLRQNYELKSYFKRLKKQEIDEFDIKMNLAFPELNQKLPGFRKNPFLMDICEYNPKTGLNGLEMIVRRNSLKIDDKIKKDVMKLRLLSDQETKNMLDTVNAETRRYLRVLLKYDQAFSERKLTASYYANMLMILRILNNYEDEFKGNHLSRLRKIEKMVLDDYSCFEEFALDAALMYKFYKLYFATQGKTYDLPSNIYNKAMYGVFRHFEWGAQNQTNV